LTTQVQINYQHKNV